jgi:hypothetical protein
MAISRQSFLDPQYATADAMSRKGLTILGCIWLGVVLLRMLFFMPISIRISFSWRPLTTFGNIFISVLYPVFLYGWIVPLSVAALRRRG